MTKRDGRQDEAFEELYRRLEETVSKLERGGLSLEESITLYEEGMELAKRCQALLDRAEQRITKLRESFAQPVQKGKEAAVGEEAAMEEGVEEALQVEEE
jgi:exodeoxyribonuclease VII small subunit